MMNLGYRTSQVHCCPDGVKTDAPPEIVYDVIKQYHAQLVAEGKATAQYQVGSAINIMNAPTRVTVDFTLKEGAQRTGESKWGKVYVPFWGPKPRAKGEKKADAEVDADAAEEKAQ